MKTKKRTCKSIKKKNFLLLVIAGLVLIVLGGSLFFFINRQTKAATYNRESTYDNYSFAVNWSKKTGQALDKGDSCFFMGLQAMNFCLRGQFSKARDLYLKCKEIDFYRHPDIYKEAQGKPVTYNGTSFDMMVIWDYVCTKWPQVGARPSFHTRQSAFWDGRYRANWMFSAATVKPQIDYAMDHPYLGDDFFRNHLLMLKIGTSLALKEDASLRAKAGDYLKFLEEKTKVNGKVIPNLFFRYILGVSITTNNINTCYNYWFPQGYTGNSVCEWIFQRDPKVIDLYRSRNADTQFHFEKVDGKKLTLSEQFINYLRKK